MHFSNKKCIPEGSRSLKRVLELPGMHFSFENWWPIGFLGRFWPKWPQMVAVNGFKASALTPFTATICFKKWSFLAQMVAVMGLFKNV